GELPLEIQHAGRRLSQLAVLCDPLLDRGLVHRVGIALLAATHPAGEHATHQVLDSRQESHGRTLRQRGGPASSTLSPSSRIFCGKFWRNIPTSSAALVMLPPLRRSAWRRKSRSKLSTTRSFASRKVVGRSAGRGVVPFSGAAALPKRSAGVISGPGA